MKLSLLQRLGSILLFGLIATSSFVATFVIFYFISDAIINPPEAPALIATMPIKAVRIVTMGRHDAINTSVLYVLAVNSTIYACGIIGTDECVPSQLPGSIDPLDTGLAPVQFITSERVIDFWAYIIHEPEASIDIQLNMTQSGKIWEQDTPRSGFEILFILPCGTITGAIIAVMMTWVVNRQLMRGQERRKQRTPIPIDLPSTDIEA